MEIVFHIGANCTDEDRLLKSLLKNGEVFEEHGIKVPGPGKYRRLIRETIQNLDGNPPSPDTRGILLDAILDSDMPRRLVLSNANFVCIANRIFDKGVFYEQVEAKVRALLQLFPDDTISLCLALRNPATFVPEAFKQSKASTLDGYLKGFHPTQIRWSDIVKRIRHVAPDCNLMVWCNEDTPLIWAELIRVISGVAPSAKITGGFDLLASIMSPEGMNRFLNYLRQHPPQTAPQKRRIIAAFLDKYAIDDEMEEEVDLPGMTDQMIESLTAIYEQDVAMIAEMDGVTFIAP
jgi:hypothetical protein